MLYFEPASALQGAWLSMSLTTEEPVFSRCDGIEPEYVRFAQSQSEELTNKISVKELKQTAGNALKASVAIADDAPVGAYDVFFHCDSATVLSGRLTIRQRRAEPKIAILPNEVAAGTIRAKLLILGTNVRFSQSESHVAFEMPDKVTVLEEKVLSSTQMEVTVSVSGSAPAKSMEVAVITGQEVARGRIEVVPLVIPAIAVQPTWIERPGGDGAESTYTLTVQGKNIPFQRPREGGDEDGSPGLDGDAEPLGTTVSFPDNSGLAVTQVKYISPVSLEVEVELDSTTPVGVTPLVVTSADAVAKTSFAVRRPEGAAGLEFYPRAIVRGVGESVVWVRALGFDLSPLVDKAVSKDQVSVGFVNPECFSSRTRCVVHAYEVNPPLGADGSGGSTTMWIRASVTDDYPEDFARLKIRTPAGEVSERIEVAAPDGTQLVADSLQLFQGDVSWMGFTLAGGEFSSADARPFYNRSGVEVLKQQQGMQHLVRVNVAPDAPTGPLEVRIETGGRVHSAVVKVLPDGTDVGVRVVPEQIFYEQREAVLQVELDGMIYDEARTRFTFDDPEVRVVESAKIDDKTVRVKVLSGPGAFSEPLILYVDSVDSYDQPQHAAASLRFVSRTTRIPKVTPESLYRAAGGSHTLEISGFGFAWSENTVVQAVEEIGLELTSVRADSTDPTRLFVDVELAEEGPGGWTGLVLVSDKETMAVALHIVSGADESLTMEVTPQAVKPGAAGLPLSFRLPAQASLPWSLEAAWSGDASAHVGRPQRLNPSEDGSPRAKALLDVSRKTSAPADVPLYLLTNSGAAVGFVSVEETTLGELVEQIPEEVVADPGEKVPLFFRAKTWPAVLETTNGDSAYAPIDLDLVPSSRFGAFSMGRAERVWFMEGEDRWVDATVGESAAITPVLGVRSWDSWGSKESWESRLLEAGSPQILSSSCDIPYLVRGRIDNPFDEIEISLEDAACPFAAVVVARQLVDRAWETPDTWLGLYVGADGSGPSIAKSSGWPAGGADPTVFAGARAEGGVGLVVGAERGTTGSFVVHLRGQNIIREISRDPAFSFIEVELNPREDIEKLSLELLDAETGLVVGTYSFAGKELEAGDGVVVIGAPGTLGREGVDAASAVSVFPDDSPFAVLLRSDGEVVDAVQVGGDGSFGEGAPIALDGPVHMERQGRVDTDDNAFDFVGWSKGSPGR